MTVSQLPTDIRKDFYKAYVAQRYNIILYPAFQKLIMRNLDHDFSDIESRSANQALRIQAYIDALFGDSK